MKTNSAGKRTSLSDRVYTAEYNYTVGGVPETEGEDCLKLVKHALVTNLNLEEGKANSVMCCGTHCVRKKKRSGNPSKPRPISTRNFYMQSRQRPWLAALC